MTDFLNQHPDILLTEGALEHWYDLSTYAKRHTLLTFIIGLTLWLNYPDQKRRMQAVHALLRCRALEARTPREFAFRLHENLGTTSSTKPYVAVFDDGYAYTEIVATFNKIEQDGSYILLTGVPLFVDISCSLISF